ncbi:MAG: GPW/gp25 family protein [Methylocella sp.]
MSNGSNGPTDIIGRGCKFPPKVNASGGLDWSNGPHRIRDAIWIVLSTSPGERVMRPTFGAGVQNFVFRPNSTASQKRLASAISDALSNWEPRINIVKIDVSVGDEPNLVNISIDYTIRTKNELFNLVYPLYLQEGVG